MMLASSVRSKLHDDIISLIIEHTTGYDTLQNWCSATTTKPHIHLIALREAHRTFIIDPIQGMSDSFSLTTVMQLTKMEPEPCLVQKGTLFRMSRHVAELTAAMQRSEKVALLTLRGTHIIKSFLGS